jgi:hypothetical protein
MKTNTKIKLEDAIKNAARYIEQMQLMDDVQLSKNLDLFRQQIEIAYKQKNYEAYELLCEYEIQVIKARVNKDYANDIKNKPNS